MRNIVNREYIVTFLPEQFARRELWRVSMAGITYPDRHYHIEREHSDICCIEYVISGRGRVEVDGRLFFPEAGDVYLLPCAHTHRYRSDPEEPWEKIWMNTHGTLAAALPALYGLTETVLFKNRPLYPLFQDFLRLCVEEREDPDALSRKTCLLFHELLLRLAAGGETGDSAFPSGIGGEGGAYVETGLAAQRESAAAIKGYIDNHIYSSLSLSGLAEYFSLSVSQLIRCFKAAYGTTPYEYILRRKIDTACLLLENTGMSVKEIAYRLHFADEHYFSNVFKKRTGRTPGEWRRRQ